ncbi:MAG: hypothetical protein HY057_11725 [Rhodospirillales bacterium]|nr:hypothetical protein [Rhodospirillales bacterium]
MAAAIGLLALAAAAALLALAFRPESHVFGTPLTEDGFYALSVARNIAASRGITIDGATLTNGFQPLFTFIEAAAFRLAGGDSALGLRFILAIAWAIHIAGALAVGLVARDAAPEAARPGSERHLRFALGALLYLVAVKNFNEFYSGLETGCAMMFYAFAWRAYQHGWTEKLPTLLGFGVLLGLAVLARIDAAVLVVILAANELRRGGGFFSPLAIGRAAALGGTALVVSGPWWAYNYFWFGALMPTSGAAQQAFGLEMDRLAEAAWALRMMAMPWIFAGAYESWATDALRSAALVAAAAAWWRWRKTRRAPPAGEIAPAIDRRTREFALCLIAAMAILVVYYTLFFFATWFYIRYFMPLTLLAFVAVPVWWARMIAAGRGPAFLHLGVAGALTVYGAGLAVLAQGDRGIFGKAAHHDQVALVQRYVPPGDPVAAGQSGTLGFFRDRVVNVDGKVNPAALAWRGNMTAYLESRGIGWFVDTDWYVALNLGPDPASRGWRPAGENGDFRLYRFAGAATPKP